MQVIEVPSSSLILLKSYTLNQCSRLLLHLSKIIMAAIRRNEIKRAEATNSLIS